MNFRDMKFGAEPKKVGILLALVAVAAYFFFSSRTPGGSSTPTPARPAASLATPSPQPGKAVPTRNISRSTMRVTQGGVGKSATEFRPSFKAKDIDRASVDPTLHLNMLARLQDVKVEGANRSLFQFSEGAPAELKVAEPKNIAVAYTPHDRPLAPQPPKPEVKPEDPPAPPIPLKFYGFVNPRRASNKQAFFLDGEDIIIASEGETVKKRYKIVRIGVNSAVVEDTQFKRNNQQTLPLEAELPG